MTCRKAPSTLTLCAAERWRIQAASTLTAEAHGSDGQHQLTFDLGRGQETAPSLDDHPAGDHPEREHVQQRRKDLQAVIAESPLRGGGPLREVHGGQGEADGRRVGQHVPRVGDEGEAAGEDAAGDFDEHVAGDEHQRDGQPAPAHAAQIMAVPARAVMVMRMAAIRFAIGTHGHRAVRRPRRQRGTPGGRRPPRYSLGSAGVNGGRAIPARDGRHAPPAVRAWSAFSRAAGIVVVPAARGESPRCIRAAMHPA